MKIFCIKYWAKPLFFFLLFCSLLVSSAPAQTQVVCEEGDCPSDLLSIALDAPLQYDAASPSNKQRTEQFKQAYLQVRQVKNGQGQDPSWNARYQTNQLNGPSCLRLNQLESYFAFEYEQNPDFQAFVDQNESNIQGFKEQSFESSRRALNLARRMETYCPTEVKKLDKKDGPSTEDLPTVYRKLGQVLGYFDESGKLLKPLKDIAAEAPSTASEEGEEEDPAADAADFSKLSKGKQVEALQQQVAQLPVGAEQKNTLSGLADDWAATRPKQGELATSLESLEPRFNELLPKPEALLGKLDADQKAIDQLNAFKPKHPRPALTATLDELGKRRKDLSKQSQALDDASGKLKTQYDQQTQASEALLAEIDQRAAAIKALQGELDALEQKRNDLVAKLDDKPKKILEELIQEVSETEKAAADLLAKMETEQQQKEKLLKDLDAQAQARDEVKQQLEKLEQEADQRTQDEQQLEKDIQAVELEAEAIKQQEAKAKELQDKLTFLKSEEALKERVSICEEYLENLMAKTNEVESNQDKYRRENAELTNLPAEIQGKLGDMKLLLNKLKLGESDVPVTNKTLSKIDRLLEKVTIIGSSAEVLTNKQKKLQERIDDFDQDLKRVKGLYASMVENLDKMQSEIAALGKERTDLQGKLDQASDNVGEVEGLVSDFLNRFGAFEERSKCISKEDEVEALRREQATIQEELVKLQTEWNEAVGEEAKIVQEAAAVEQEIKEYTQLMIAMKQEEAEMKETFGAEVTLNPVPVQEWAEGLQVERSYWQATFFPDDELIKGMKGRYFQINLKDAEKKEKMLFAPGKYSLDKTTFRTNYGATIGSFVTEALGYLKKGDEGQVKLFIQGSADITGQETFRGRMDSDYRFEEITILPLEEDQKRFSNEPLVKEIPDSFRNDDLPNLRARYLKEVIGAYTQKFDPIILEGVVKDFEAELERNAEIYLFFPDELLKKYE